MAQRKSKSAALSFLVATIGALSSNLDPVFAQSERIPGRFDRIPDRNLSFPDSNIRIPNNLGFTNPSLHKLKSVKRQLGLSSIYRYNNLPSFRRGALNQRFSAGEARVDLRPYLSSPTSLSTIHRNLQNNVMAGSLKGNAQILRSTRTKGLVITEQLSFQPKSSTCSSRTIPAASKGFCFNTSRGSLKRKSSGRSLSIPGGTRAPIDNRISVKDKKTLRAKATILSNNLKKASKGEGNAKLPSWAKNLSRSALQRLASSDLKALEKALLNNSKVRISRTIYMPPANVSLREISKLPTIKKIKNYRARNGQATYTSSAPRNNAGRAFEHQTKHIFLTGFTYADSFYWGDVYEYEVDYGIGTELIGVYPFASAYYGFGVRFPLEVTNTYKYQGGNRSNAQVNVSIKPIDGDDSEYLQTGLAGDMVFNGKEIVAELGGYAGVSYNTPFGNGTLQTPSDAKIDFTNYLPDSLNKGNFAPPTYGGNLPLADPIIVPLDLMGGIGNYSISDFGISVTAYPGVTIGLTSTDMGIKLLDNKNNNLATSISYKRNRKRGSVKVVQGKSRYILKEPYYNLALSLTPGVQLSGSAGLGAWSTSLTEYIDFPSLAINIPTDGVPFSCHKGTTCTRTYSVNNLTREAETESTSSPAAKKQTLKLKKEYRLKDDDYFENEYKNYTTNDTFENVPRGRSANTPNVKQFKPLAMKNSPRHCAGGEVRLEDWDKVKIDHLGTARLWVSLRVYEGTSCNSNEKESEYLGVRANGTQSTSGQPLLVVPEGERRSATKELNTGDGGYGRIKYTLRNTTRN